MALPAYSEFRDGFNVGVLELCTDWITVASPSSQDDSGGNIYSAPITYGALPTTSVANPFALTPSTDPYFAQTSNNTASNALFRCQFVAYQKEVMGGEGNSLILAGKYILPAAQWVDYPAFMNLYNWFYRRNNVDVQNPKGYEQVKVASISAKHDLNRKISHYILEVGR